MKNSIFFILNYGGDGGRGVVGEGVNERGLNKWNHGKMIKIS